MIKTKRPDDYRKFTGLVDHLLTVSHEEIKRREEEYRKHAAANPNRRGPKPGAKRQTV